MYSVNEFWEKIFEKLKILEHLKNEEYFVLSRTDCSMVFNNGFKLRLEDYFIFKSKEDLPAIFIENNLVILQKYKSTFSICHADNYFIVPTMNYPSTTYRNKLKVLSTKSFKRDPISFGLSLLNSGLFTDLLASVDDTNLYLSEVYSYNSILSDSTDIKVVYKSLKTNKTDLMRVGHVKLFYDFILEDSSSLYIVNIKNSGSKTVNRSLLYNVMKSFDELTNKAIVFIELYKNDYSIDMYELCFNDSNDIYSLESINEMRFAVDVEEHVEKVSEFILTDQKNEYFVSKDKVPFPQANDFDKVIKYCDLIYSNKKHLQDLITELGITSRQVTYYRDSCLFLKLVRLQDREIYLNPELSKIYREGTVKEKYGFFMASMIENEILFKCYNLYTIDNLTIDTFKHTVSNVYNMSDSTLKRRLSTVRSWFKWLSRIIELNKKNVNYDITKVGLIEQVKNIVNESNSKNIRMFILKERLNESLEYGLDDRELMRKINKSDMYFSEELQILFETKDDYYNYLK